MQIQRVPTLLHEVADVRNWIVQHIPQSASLAGHDLFVKIGNDYCCGEALAFDGLLQGLPHPAAEIESHLLAMEQAGLLIEQPGADGQGRQIIPTQSFLDLLRQYQTKYESLFILRTDLRKRQLLADVPDAGLRQLVEVMYDHFYDLDWLYLHNFGAICFLMASLVQRAALAHGHRAQLHSCHVDISGPKGSFKLGSPGYATAGQIEGHAVCVINDAVLVDFGLGNVRRGYRRNFYWGLACPYAPQAEAMGSMLLPQGETVTWKNDWQTPDGPAEFARYAETVEQLFPRYVDFFG